MKKNVLLFGIIVVGSYFFYGIFTAISNVKNYRIIDFLIVITMLLLVLLLEVFLIRKYKKAKQKNISVATIPENPVEVKVTKTDAPPETLKQMKKYYTVVQLQDDLRILHDSISLMKSTKDIDTFLSRSEIAMRSSLTIEQAKNANIFVQSNFLSSKEVMDLKLQLLPNVLNTAYNKMKSDASRLKTAKGQLGRYQKFLDYLEENEYDLDICDNYEEIVSLTQKEITNL